MSPISVGLGGVPFFVLRSSKSMAISSLRACRSFSSRADSGVPTSPSLRSAREHRCVRAHAAGRQTTQAAGTAQRGPGLRHLAEHQEARKVALVGKRERSQLRDCLVSPSHYVIYDPFPSKQSKCSLTTRRRPRHAQADHGRRMQRPTASQSEMRCYRVLSTRKYTSSRHAQADPEPPSAGGPEPERDSLQPAII